MAANNNSLGKAKKAKKDEFYTQLPDIEKELRHYEHHFKDKVVLCNCDDPKVSNFFVYFVRNFKHLGLKRLITTCYKNNEPSLFSNNDSEQAVYLIYDGGDDNNPDPVKVSTTAVPLKGDGDFRSMECIELLKQADIVVTNPPFSLFREYVAQLIKYEKRFLILGNQNNISYKEIFPLVQSNQIWLGYNSGQQEFEVPLDFEKDNTYQDAINMNIFQIGEIANHLSEEVKESMLGIPWPQIIGIRNIIAHGYVSVDTRIIWDTLRTDIPSLKDKIEKGLNL